MSNKGILVFLSRTFAFMSSVTYVVLVALTGAMLRPGLAASQLPPHPSAQPNAGHSHPAGRDRSLPRPDPFQLSEALLALSAVGFLETADIIDLRQRLVTLDRGVRADFDRVGARVLNAAKPAKMQQRYQEARDAYTSAMEQLLADLDTLKRTEDPAEKTVASRAIAEQLSSGALARPHQTLDFDHLPFGRAEAEKQPPRLSRVEYQRRLPAGPASDAATRATKAAGLPQPDDTAENEDVQITAEIEALAADLGGNPLEIHRWVHDNVELVPTFGSTRGSQMTLLSRRGNAFDIASLLIALLRAADVPARYVFGTVQIPAPQVMNWLGGVDSPQLAQRVLAEGGIPNAGVVEEGEVTQIRLEHVWVEAWVDFVPSRGANPKEGDTWVPMDSSFKLHEFIEPAGLFTALPFGLEDLQDEVLSNATVDDALGLVSGIDEALIYDAMTAYEEDAGEFFLDTGTEPGRQALVGGKVIVPFGETALAASLPYEILAQGDPVATLPKEMRLGVSLRGFSAAVDRAAGDPSFTFDVSLPALNSRRLGITYEPATEADAEVIAEAAAAGDTALPLYLIDLRTLVKLDDEVVATGPVVRMGASQLVDVVLRDIDDTSVVSFKVVAGDEMVFGITAGDITQEVVQDRFDKVPADSAAENLHQSALHFWMQSDFFNALNAESLGVHVQRRLSVGLFSSPLTVSYLFGTPHSGYYISRFMDVKRSYLGVAGDDPNLERTFQQQSGRLTSFLEGLVFDQLFAEDGVATAFSAIELIADANRRGIPIYSITADNLAAVLPLLSVGAAVENDIADAVALGMTVLVPEQAMSRGDWTGVGYVVEDPETGAAGYLISGGLAGGGMTDCDPELEPLVRAILIILLVLALILLIIATIKSMGTLGGILKPAFAAIFASILMLLGAASASAVPAFRKGGQADPCNCPPLPPAPPCQFHPVPPHDHHYGCPDDHWHYFTVHQGPAPECAVRLIRRFGDCGPPPVPCPPC